MKITGWGASLLGAFLAVAALLVSCVERETKKLTGVALRQLEEISEAGLPTLEKENLVEAEFIDIFRRVAERYKKTGDLVAGKKRGEPDILQLACLFKKREPDDESPLLLAVGTYLLPETTAEEIIPVVDTLLAGGADFKKSGTNSDDFLTQAAFACEREEVLLHLLDKGAKPDAQTVLPPALHGWAEALKRLLPMVGNRTEGLLHAVATGCCQFEGDYLRCLHILLEKGADIHAPETLDDPGSTALLRIAAEMSALEENDLHLPQAVDVFAYLVQRGADPYLRAEEDESYPGFAPYDFLARRPKLLAALRDKGITLQPPALRINGGKNLPADICRAALYKPSEKEVAPFFETIAGVLRPTPEMLGAEIYAQALEKGVHLLGDIDAERAAQRITEMPLWQQALGTQDAEIVMTSLLAALQDTPSIKLPADFLYHQAERAQREGRGEEASVLVELMGRSDDGAELLLLCMEDSRLPIRAGAYAARLHSDGLPDARNGGVAAWLTEYGREADTDFLREAVLLTSPERLWSGNMEKAALDDPEELDAVMAQGDDWKYEAEIAVARHFLANKAQFSPSFIL